ncbi:unnamed protein product [Rhizopus stolonifer]
MKVQEITEEDLIALSVKRGHRRLVQKELATLARVPIIVNNSNPISQAVSSSPVDSSKFHHHMNSKNKTGNEISSGCASMQSSLPSSSSFPFTTILCSSDTRGLNDGKKSHDEKYKRHPKPDLNAPVKPPSAYVTFSNSARAQLKDRNLSFSEVAKIVGDRWRNLEPREKQLYELTAIEAKDKYVISLSKYKNTQEYKDYQAYLADFKNKQEEENKRIMRERKRAKRDSPTSVSSGSIADCSSNGNNSSGSSVSNNTSLFLSTDYYNTENTIFPSVGINSSYDS